MRTVPPGPEQPEGPGIPDETLMRLYANRLADVALRQAMRLAGALEPGPDDRAERPAPQDELFLVGPDGDCTYISFDEGDLEVTRERRQFRDGTMRPDQSFMISRSGVDGNVMEVFWADDEPPVRPADLLAISHAVDSAAIVTAEAYETAAAAGRGDVSVETPVTEVEEPEEADGAAAGPSRFRRIVALLGVSSLLAATASTGIVAFIGREEAAAAPAGPSAGSRAPDTTAAPLATIAP